MAFVDEGVRIDADFGCGSAGEIRVVDDCYEIEPKPEPVPEWFTAALEEHFAGAGVPREYACCVRISSLADEQRECALRFHFSKTIGRRYMAPPYWICREGRWRMIAVPLRTLSPSATSICVVLWPVPSGKRPKVRRILSGDR